MTAPTPADLLKLAEDALRLSVSRVERHREGLARYLMDPAKDLRVDPLEAFVQPLTRSVQRAEADRRALYAAQAMRNAYDALPFPSPAEAAAEENRQANERFSEPSEDLWRVTAMTQISGVVRDQYVPREVVMDLTTPDAARIFAATMTEQGATEISVDFYEAEHDYIVREPFAIDPGTAGWADLTDAQMRGEA